MVNLGNGKVESAFESAEKAFDNASLFFKRGYPLQMQLSFQHADNHNFIL
jgi:hypothetical protein